MIAAGWLTESIGSTAAICTTIAFLPQLIRVGRRRSVDDISLWMFLLFSTGGALWLVYGLLIRAVPLIAANGVTSALAIFILKLRYAGRRRVLAAAAQNQAE
jgi:MtN3 and saliva related transmembrane protein